MCGVAVADEHGHVADTQDHRLLCVCRPCYLLFSADGAGGARFRGVGTTVRVVDDLALERAGRGRSLQIPVELAFFLSQGDPPSYAAFYPGPAAPPSPPSTCRRGRTSWPRTPPWPPCSRTSRRSCCGTTTPASPATSPRSTSATSWSGSSARTGSVWPAAPRSGSGSTPSSTTSRARERPHQPGRLRWPSSTSPAPSSRRTATPRPRRSRSGCGRPGPRASGCTRPRSAARSGSSRSAGRYDDAEADGPGRPVRRAGALGEHHAAAPAGVPHPAAARVHRATTDFDLALPCSYDFDVAAHRYLDALADGEVPLLLLFSGTVFTGTAGALPGLARCRGTRRPGSGLPVRVWREAMDAHFPGQAWLRLDRHTFDRLAGVPHPPPARRLGGHGRAAAQGGGGMSTRMSFDGRPGSGGRGPLRGLRPLPLPGQLAEEPGPLPVGRADARGRGRASTRRSGARRRTTVVVDGRRARLEVQVRCLQVQRRRVEARTADGFVEVPRLETARHHPRAVGRGRRAGDDASRCRWPTGPAPRHDWELAGGEDDEDLLDDGARSSVGWSAPASRSGSRVDVDGDAPALAVRRRAGAGRRHQRARPTTPDPGTTRPGLAAPGGRGGAPAAPGRGRRVRLPAGPAPVGARVRRGVRERRHSSRSCMGDPGDARGDAQLADHPLRPPPGRGAEQLRLLRRPRDRRAAQPADDDPLRGGEARDAWHRPADGRAARRGRVDQPRPVGPAARHGPLPRRHDRRGPSRSAARRARPPSRRGAVVGPGSGRARSTPRPTRSWSGRSRSAAAAGSCSGPGSGARTPSTCSSPGGRRRWPRSSTTSTRASTSR